jgi:hypothetical protein
MTEDSFSSAVSEGMGKVGPGVKLPPAAGEVAVVLREAAREISGQYKCRFSLWVEPCPERENWVTLWCKSSRWWSEGVSRFLALVVFGAGGVSGHVSINTREFDFSDLATFRVALREFFASPECGRVMRKVLNFNFWRER